MKCYKVTFDKDTKTILVFASNSGEAATVFCTWQDSALGCMPEEFSVERWQASRLSGEHKPLRMAMEAGRAGIGILHPTTAPVATSSSMMRSNTSCFCRRVISGLFSFGIAQLLPDDLTWKPYRSTSALTRWKKGWPGVLPLLIV